MTKQSLIRVQSIKRLLCTSVLLGLVMCCMQSPSRLLNATCTPNTSNGCYQQAPDRCYSHTEKTTTKPQDLCLVHMARCTRLHQLLPHRLYVSLAVRREYSSPGHSGSTSTSSCITTTRHPAVRALRQPCRALRVLVSRPQRLYINYAVRRHDVVFWAYVYLDDLPRLVSTRKLVEDGSRDINN
jgi:hypothetical protein